MRFIDCTWLMMVRVPRSRNSASPLASLSASFICRRSADSWIGVSGFLISCAPAAGDLAPGGAALGGDQARDIVENDHVAATARLGQRRAAQQQHLRHAVRALDFELAVPFAAATAEAAPDRLPELVLARPVVDRAANRSPKSSSRMVWAPALAFRSTNWRSNTSTPAEMLARIDPR